MLDWRKRQSTQAKVRDTIKDVLDVGLPRAYSPELYEQKCSIVFEHIYESYPNSGERVYAAANNRSGVACRCGHGTSPIVLGGVLPSFFFSAAMGKRSTSWSW